MRGRLGRLHDFVSREEISAGREWIPASRRRSLSFSTIYFGEAGNKPLVRWFTLVCVSEGRSSPESFEELAMPLFERLYNFAHWLTQDRQEAEDLVQETYVKALKGFGSFQTGTNFRAWIYQILRNAFLTSRTGLKVTMT